jgi:hypothetical protein
MKVLSIQRYRFFLLSSYLKYRLAILIFVNAQNETINDTELILSSFTRCGSGYKMVRGECVDIDECKYGHNCVRGQTCTNTLGSYFCACSVGTRLDFKSGECKVKFQKLSLTERP